MKPKKILCLGLILFTVKTIAQTPNYLTRVGNHIEDACGKTVRLTGVNWFGFETSNKCPHGLWSRDYQSMLEQIKFLGFNCIRIPWSNAILDPAAQASGLTTSGTDPYNSRTPMNGDLQGLKPIEILDKIITYCKTLGLKIILDHHSIQPDGYANEPLWYTNTFTEQQWISDWVTMATRYNNNDVVIAFDIENEPHAQATWGNTSATTDWNKAAERCANQILTANPNALIIIEGVETNGGSGYWWGGNLRGANSFPIVISKPEKLVYSIHEYGPEIFTQTWFSDASFPTNMPTIWNDTYGYLHNNNTGHIYVGEFGIKDTSSINGKAGVWFNAFLQYMSTKFSWTFWCMNPNSGDTGGILADDWITVNQWKVTKLKPYMAPLIGTCTVTEVEGNKKNKNEFILYPNPSNGIFTLQSNSPSQKTNLKVLNPVGQIIFSADFSLSTEESKNIDIRQFPAGIYMLQLTSDKDQQTIKIIKY